MRHIAERYTLLEQGIHVLRCLCGMFRLHAQSG